MEQEEPKLHSFCETTEEKCTMNYCDENGGINRKRNLVTELPLQTDENGKPLTYWGGLKDRTCDHTNCREVCPECQILHISKDCEEVKNWDSFVEEKNKELFAEEYANGKSSSEVFRDAHKKDFIAGFEKAKETLYTEEQVREAFHIGRLYQGREGDTNIQQYLQSLKKD